MANINPIDQAWITVALSLVGKFGSSNTFAVIFIYSAEVFPTTTRNLGIGMCSFSARIGGILAPYISDLGNFVGGNLGLALSLIIFGSASLAAGLLTLLLPETTNRILPESVKEAQEFGRSEKSRTGGKKNHERGFKGSSYALMKGDKNLESGQSGTTATAMTEI